jgi:hypothetical protein
MIKAIDDIGSWLIHISIITILGIIFYIGVSFKDDLKMKEIKKSCKTIGHFYIDEKESIKCQLIQN